MKVQRIKGDGREIYKKKSRLSAKKETVVSFVVLGVVLLYVVARALI